MTDSSSERANYFVYVYRIGGVMAYVGKGTGFRMTKHLKASHNPILAEWIARANQAGVLVQHRKIKRGLTHDEALRLEGRCFEKWHRTLCNKNHPYPALEVERWEAELQEPGYLAFAAEQDAWLDAANAFYEGKLSPEDAAVYGFTETSEPEPQPERKRRKT
jgi:hypothetical protein